MKQGKVERVRSSLVRKLYQKRDYFDLAILMAILMASHINPTYSTEINTYNAVETFNDVIGAKLEIVA